MSQPASARRIEIELEAFEIARAYDGPLRGAPEPCLLLGVFHVSAGRAVTVGRSLTRIEPPGDLPGRVELGRTLVRASVLASSAEAPRMFVVLAIAVEADSGRDVQSLYASLEHPERLAIWDEAQPIPEPKAIAELGGLPASAAPVAEPARVLHRDADLSSTLRRDDFVGSLVVRLSADPTLRPSEWRFQFCSPDGLNAWTAVLLARVS